MYIFGFIIPIFSFFLQIWPRLINKYFGIDTWRHLMYADYIRKYRRLPQSIEDRYITSGPFGYPPFLLIILSFFPKKFADNYQFIFSPLFDVLHNYFIFASILLISHNIGFALLGQLIAALTPVVVIEASNLNTRIVSYLLFSVSFFSLLFFSINGNFILLALAGGALFLLFFTHRFGIQAYAFTIIGFSFVERNFFYLFFFIGIFFLVVMLGGQVYKAILREHLGSLNYWRAKIENRFSHQFLKMKKMKRKKDFINKLYGLSTKFSFLYIFGENPWLGLLILLILAKNIFYISLPSMLSADISSKLLLWIIISTVVTIAVLAIKQLRFLGEGYRYIEYATFPISILLASYLSSLIRYRFDFFYVFIFFCVLVLIGTILLQIKTVLRDRNRTIDKAKWEIINFLKKMGKDVRLGVFPIQLGDAMMYFIDGKVLTSDSLVGLEKLVDIFPVVRKPMRDIIARYNLNYIFFDKQYVSLEELNLKEYKIVKDMNDYVLIKV